MVCLCVIGAGIAGINECLCACGTGIDAILAEHIKQMKSLPVVHAQDFCRRQEIRFRRSIDNVAWETSSDADDLREHPLGRLVSLKRDGFSFCHPLRVIWSFVFSFRKRNQAPAEVGAGDSTRTALFHEQS